MGPIDRRRGLARISSLTAACVAASLSAGLGCDKDKDKAAAASEVSAKSAAVTAAPQYPPVPAAPKSLGLIRPARENPTTPAKVQLGRKLFFDKRLSVDGSRSCYSCHQNEDGTGGHEPTAIGANNKALTRHAPILWNVAYLPVFYWDGRATSLEAQAKGAWGGGNMGVGADNLVKKADEIGALPEYKKLFDEVFPGDGATPDTVAMAIAAYERTLFCGDTAFDRFIGGDKTALTPDQQDGWKLFVGKAGCHNCHTPPLFSDAYGTESGSYHNTGKGTDGKKEEEVDVGRMKISENPSEWAAFKTPTLRNVSKSAPYFHDGSAAKLEDAVRFMAGGGLKNKNLDPKLVDKKLSDEDIGKIVAFLGGLECKGTLDAPK